MGRASFCHQLIAGFFNDMRIKPFAASKRPKTAKLRYARPLLGLNQAFLTL